ncbi:MAG: hypothetical protein Q8M01_21160 [Rubrivivax sp.]|nr:hypothetical protein [Rubrivivax sp.]
MQVAAPRHFSPGAGVPGGRSARLAARRAFVELKITFMQALADLPQARWLHAQVRSAEEPVDLWLLRAPVFAALDGVDPEFRQRRRALRRGLDSVFPELESASGFVPF